MNVNQQHYLDVLGQLNLDDLHLQQAFDYYQQQYQLSDVAQKFVHRHDLIKKHKKAHTFIGLCDRTMGKNILKRKTPEGAMIRGSLQRCGLIRASGHELFRGCVIFVTLDNNNHPKSAIGYRIGRIRHGDKQVIEWCRPLERDFIATGLSFARQIIHGQTYH